MLLLHRASSKGSKHTVPLSIVGSPDGIEHLCGLPGPSSSQTLSDMAEAQHLDSPGAESHPALSRNATIGMVVAGIAFAAWMGFWFLMSAMVMMASDGCHTDVCSDAVGRLTITAFASQAVIAIAAPSFAVRGSKPLKKRLLILAIGALAAPLVWLALSELAGNATLNQPL